MLGALGAAFYGTVRAGYTSFYGHLGLTPEQAGLSQAAIVADAAALLALFILLLVLSLSVAAFGHRLAAATLPHRLATSRLAPFGFWLPLVLLVLVDGAQQALYAVSTPAQRAVAAVVICTVVLPQWWFLRPIPWLAPGLVARPSRFALPALALTGSAGLVVLDSEPVALVAWPLLLGLALAFAALALLVQDGPAGEVTRAALVLALPMAALALASQVQRGFVAQLWDIASAYFALGAALAYSGWSRAGMLATVRRLFPAAPRATAGLQRLLVVSTAAGALLAVSGAYWEASDRAGRQLINAGVLPTTPTIGGLVVPVQLVLAPGSPYAAIVCNASAIALVGRTDGTVSLFVQGPGDRRGVVTIPSEGLVVRTADVQPQPCLLTPPGGSAAP